MSSSPRFPRTRLPRTNPCWAAHVIALRETVVNVDEGPRPGHQPGGLARLRPVFRNGGSVTAGNSSQMSDGAGAVMLASEQAIRDYGLTPLARFVGYAVAGVKPEVMGIGPKEAIPKALKLAGLTRDQMDWIELNEAFAAQALAVIRDLGLDPEKVNPLGGAIALGHPLGEQAQCAWLPSPTDCVAASSAMAWSRCALVRAWARQEFRSSLMTATGGVDSAFQGRLDGIPGLQPPVVDLAAMKPAG